MPALIHKKQIIGQATDATAMIKDTVGWTCRNLIRNTSQTTTQSGVTFTVNEDMSVSTSGTASTSVVFLINDLIALDPLIEYRLTGCPERGSASTYELRLLNENMTKIASDTGDGYEFSGQSLVGVAIYISAGVNVTGLTFSPMLQKAAFKSDIYEPYHITVEEALDIIAGGTSGVLVLSTMLATGWTDDTYSFENEYPFTDYNIDIEPNGDVITKSEYLEWSKAGIVGSATSNRCRAMNGAPKVDIPIMIKVTRKS